MDHDFPLDKLVIELVICDPSGDVNETIMTRVEKHFREIIDKSLKNLPAYKAIERSEPALASQDLFG